MELKTSSIFNVEHFVLLLKKHQLGFWQYNVDTDLLEFDEGIRFLYGIPDGEFQRKFEDWIHILLPDERLRQMEVIKKVLADEIELETRFRIKTLAGEIKNIQSTAVKIRNDKNKIIQLVGLNWEVTDQIRMQNILIEQSKMASLGEITSGIAHEVNNPLSIINGKAALLKERLVSGQITNEFLISSIESIEKNSLRIEKIIRSLNSFSRRSSDEPIENVSLLQIIDEIFDMVKDRYIREKIDLLITVDENMNYENKILAKASEILQVFVNVLNNSYDAIKLKDEKWIRISIHNDIEFYTVKITDSGSPLSQNVIDNMMNPFFSTKTNEQGTGLGLSIAQQVMKSCEGNIQFNKESKNTEFILSFKKQI